ncbi:hypothetical protein [Enterobacter wuhouensis]|jgi:hypothetical protein|uniref:Uncharacterized protein n=1 Tax=Enterobacter wuhouensis TaxID=2529381 RepID=A0A4R0FXG1_9ENTR|nr:hypothetical protein [Enterobacter wuhouensis]MCV2532038.1 hypothetical protein [Enterobacter wuhouensis]TCB87823.1 hypothetical protein E0L20_22055 [Enterobacter wuhouensis]WRW33518.1 hypothetical protein VPX56_10595 [Enterobacter wuhouensis]
MPDYRFFQKGQQYIALESTDVNSASQLIAQGFEKQFEEVCAPDERAALARFADIRRNNQIDRNNFLAGAGQMPFIGLMAAAATALFRKK